MTAPVITTNDNTSCCNTANELKINSDAMNKLNENNNEHQRHKQIKNDNNHMITLSN